MKIEEFRDVYRDFAIRDKIVVPCSRCVKSDKLNKDSAIRNIELNGEFVCRSCSFTPEGRQRISEATSYKRSDETKKKMSEAKTAFFKTPKGGALKRRLSLLAAKGHAANKFENSKRNGWYPSEKSGMIFYGSSYELLLCYQLDHDDSVASYETQIAYNWKGRGRCLDFLVTYKKGRKKIIEVKPESRLTEQNVIDQISDNEAYSKMKGWDFSTCTEKDLGMSGHEIRVWADLFRNELGSEFDFVGFRMERSRQRANKHYENVISKDKVEVYCEYCKETHNPLRSTYTKNIERNGEYICERKGGSIAGKKGKIIKINPYAAEGKKKCTGPCGLVKPFEDFGADKSRRDGYASKCKVCRAEAAKKKYKDGKDV